MQAFLAVLAFSCRYTVSSSKMPVVLLRVGFLSLCVLPTLWSPSVCHLPVSDEAPADRERKSWDGVDCDPFSSVCISDDLCSSWGHGRVTLYLTSSIKQFYLYCIFMGLCT